MKKNIYLTPFFVFLHLSCQITLDQLALEEGTDKSTRWHAYSLIYDRYFSSVRDEPIKFLEIGYFKGDSARMWERYFSKARLYFIDIDQKLFTKYGKKHTPRMFFAKVDQSDEQELNNFIKTYGDNFDIIIDDGGHTMEQQISSFKVLFPHVASGGLYIIEDLHTSYWKEYGGYGSKFSPKAGPGTTIEFLKELISDINYIGACTQCADKDKCSQDILSKCSYYQSSIDSIHFYDSLCIVRKR